MLLEGLGNVHQAFGIGRIRTFGRRRIGIRMVSDEQSENSLESLCWCLIVEPNTRLGANLSGRQKGMQHFQHRLTGPVG